MKKIIYILFLLAFTLSTACNKTPEKLGMREYISWVEHPDNGLKKEKTIGEYKYKVFYKPADYIALREAVNTNKIDDVAAIQKRADEVGEIYQLNFDITSSDGKRSALKHNIKSDAEYGARINYFVSHAQEDFKLVLDTDTLPCTSYHFERTFGVTPNNTILLGFKKPKKDTNNEIQLIFKNRLFNSGDIKFLFSEKTLKNIPQLSL